MGTNQISGCLGPVRCREWGGTTNGHRVSFGGDKNVLKLDCGHGCTMLWIDEKPLTGAL